MSRSISYSINMAPVTLLFIMLKVCNCAMAEHSGTIMQTVSQRSSKFNQWLNTLTTTCSTNSECATNHICVNRKTGTNCSPNNGTCGCVRACDSADDCPTGKCAAHGEGNEFPLVCFTCGSDAVVRESPGHNCLTKYCYDSGCSRGFVCVERDLGRYTACRASHVSCSCSLSCDGSGICRDRNAQCGIYSIDGIDSLLICFTCNSINISVIEWKACGEPESSITAPPPPPLGIREQTDTGIPVVLIVGILLIVVSFIIAVVLFFLCRRSTGESNG